MIYYDERLHNMLRHKRPHGSLTEQVWAEAYILSAGAEPLGDPADPAAYAVKIGESRTMFSCHIDTVHREDGRQTIKFNRKTQTYYKTDGKPLGADDTAGCWLLLEMIDAGVPGTYVFHRGEECGGIGSTYIADRMPDFLKQFDRAIAFDRKGSTSVITHQGWGRCASDEFAEALADAINADGVSMYMPDDTGVFTDTANYIDIIPECTNISCGYANEHTGQETLHLPTLFTLRDRCLAIDWESLPTVRDPDTPDPNDYKGFSWASTKSSTRDRAHPRLVNMTYSEMLDMSYQDPETFVALVREELFGEDPLDVDDYYDNMAGWA